MKNNGEDRSDLCIKINEKDNNKIENTTRKRHNEQILQSVYILLVVFIYTIGYFGYLNLGKILNRY